MKIKLFTFFLVSIIIFSCCKKDEVVHVNYCEILNDTAGKKIFQYKTYPKEIWIPMPYTEKVANRQLPVAYMSSLTTEQLFFNCLHWDLIGNILLFNTHQAGYLSMSNDFNGLQELYKRENIEQLLLKKLLDIYPEDNELDCWIKVLVTEMICAQPDIINKYNEEDTFIILGKWIYIFDKITNLKDWGYYDYSPTIRALSNILIKVNYSEFISFSKTAKFENYIKGTKEIDQEIISNVIDCSKKYYNSIKHK